uniref:Uncharacterized protein n=1 Tax=Arundo donax TaxID=35708 RepID=A0A0A9EPV0_ARUDO
MRLVVWIYEVKKPLLLRIFLVFLQSISQLCVD